MGRVGGLDLTTSKNDAQATFAVTADSSFRQMMAAVAPPAGHRREVCRCVADIVRISATWLMPPGCRVLWITHAQSAATEAQEAGVGIEDIAEPADQR